MTKLNPPAPARREPMRLRCDADLDPLLRVILQAKEGERNNATFWAACRLADHVHSGQLSDGHMVDLVVGAAARNGLPITEAKQIANSALRRARRRLMNKIVELPQSIVKRLDRAGRVLAPPNSVIAEAVEIDNGSVTQDGVARVFARRYGDKLRFCHDTGKWYEWTGTHWQVDKIAKAFQFVRELGREYTEDAKPAN